MTKYTQTLQSFNDNFVHICIYYRDVLSKKKKDLFDLYDVICLISSYVYRYRFNFKGNQIKYNLKFYKKGKIIPSAASIFVPLRNLSSFYFL